MKKIFAIAALVIAGTTIATAQQPDAEYQLLRYRYTVNADGTTDYNVRKEVRFIRNRAITAYADKGETFIVYDPQYETLTINESYTLRPDGSRVATPDNAFVEQLPGNCTNCGRFNHLRELAIVHTALEYNAVTVLDYTIHRSSDLLCGRLQTVQDCPIDRLEIELVVPSNQELSVNLLKSQFVDINPRVSQTPYSYKLTATNVPQTFVAPYLPDAEVLYPTLIFYNGTPQYKPEFEQERLPQAAATIVNLAGETPTATAINLRNFVADNIHLNDIPADMLGYTHATAAETWNSGCGTHTDRAVLLAAMLRTAGLQASVYGHDYTRVAVIIDTMEYDVTPDAKPATLPLIGEAHDLVSTVNVNNTVDAQLETLEGGYYRYTIPTEPGAMQPLLAALTPSRTAPLQLRPCDETYSYTVKLPKGMKMVGKQVDETRNFGDLGKVSVSIKQSGSKLKIKRHLNIDKDIVSGDDYNHLRQMLAVWESHRQVIFKQK
ncbi:MAG: DUF3857 domain-containing protein [Bacteroidales bacterium]|nr:DUF3857 domain-containing protein [Bacteroidales bacterium]